MTSKANSGNMGDTVTVTTDKSIEMSLVETTEALKNTKVLSARGKAQLSKNAKARIRVNNRQFAKTPIIADFTEESAIEYIPYDKIRIAYDANGNILYQRGRDSKRVTQMAHEWNNRKKAVPVVNLRDDGYYYLIDGHQRWSAFGMISNHPDTLRCEIFVGLTPEQEAQLFADLDTQRQGLTTGSRFKALMVANDPDVLEIVEAATKCGLMINPDKGPIANNLRSHGTIMNIHRRQGKAGLERIFYITANAWPNTKYVGSAWTLRGLEVFFNRYGHVANDQHLIDVLAKTTPAMIENTARVNMGTLSSAISQYVARVIHNYYNRGMKKNRLPDWS